MIQEVRVTPAQVQIVLAGDIFFQGAKAVQKSLFGYIDAGHTEISIDLSGVDYIDSTGLGVLLLCHNQALAKQCQLEIKGLQGEVRELFVLTELDKKMKIVSD